MSELTQTRERMEQWRMDSAAKQATITELLEALEMAHAYFIKGNVNVGLVSVVIQKVNAALAKAKA